MARLQRLQGRLRAAAATYAEMLGRGMVSAHQFGDLWLASRAHRKVMLNPVYRRIGVAAVDTPHGRLVVVNMVRR